MNFLNLLASLFLLGTARAKADVAAWKTRTVYQILTDRFWRSNGDTKTPCDLKKYCGGDFTGIQQKLSYIKDMGFDAIWISPVVDNMADGYHGYWFQDWEKISKEFGGEDNLKKLVDECHRQNILVMVDVVANHVAPIGYDYSSIYPFNKQYHYHPDCEVVDWKNQWQVENCRLLFLPDLDQSVPFVRKYLIDWVRRHVEKFNFDAIRIDTVPHIERTFWKDYTRSADVFSIGEILNPDDAYIGDYQNYMDATLNYGMYFTLKEVFGNNVSMKAISSRWTSIKQHFRDPDALGLFVDNHDNPRFLFTQNDTRLFKSAIAFSLTARGIPMMYYGSEQGYNGGVDPLNREPLWENMDPSHEIYQIVKMINRARRIQRTAWGTFTERSSSDDLYTYSRGAMFVALTNQLDKTIQSTVFRPGFDAGTSVCNIFRPADCLTVGEEGLKITLMGGEVKIYINRDSKYFTSSTDDPLDMASVE